MEEDELQVNLNYLAKRYIKDDSLIEQLEIQIANNKAKYVLAEIDHNKVEPYSESDMELIKDIAYFYC